MAEAQQSRAQADAHRGGVSSNRGGPAAQEQAARSSSQSQFVAGRGFKFNPGLNLQGYDGRGGFFRGRASYPFRGHARGRGRRGALTGHNSGGRGSEMATPFGRNNRGRGGSSRPGRGAGHQPAASDPPANQDGAQANSAPAGTAAAPTTAAPTTAHASSSAPPAASTAAIIAGDEQASLSVGIGNEGNKIETAAEREHAGKLVQGAKRKHKKPYCYRCLTKGHVISECTTDIYCDICGVDSHVTKACPHLKVAKPTAIPCGYACAGLGFYYIPYHGDQKVKVLENKENKEVLVRVKEGSLTAPQIEVELERLVPGTTDKWVIQQEGPSTFSTTFPSSDFLLESMVLWGAFETKFVEAKIVIEKKTNPYGFKYEIPKVWVQCRGLPKDLREFPVIWAVGSILGVTKTVDMRFTNQHGRARLRVAVLIPEIIPAFVDVVIGDYVYTLQFRVEKDDMAENPTPMNMDVETSDGGENGNKKAEDDRYGDLNKDMDMDSAAAAAAEGSVNNNLGTNGSNSSRHRDTRRPVAVLHPTGPVNGTQPWIARMLPAPPLGKRPAVSDASIAVRTMPPTPGDDLHVLLAKNEIPKINTQPLQIRTRKRTAATSYQDSLERATKLKARKNLDDAAAKGSI